ncbi:uncharacterized protein LOC118435055 [Folsomia candida]|uniref:uncharacterized protein LOC118435055 n=1 Tax=Folsomia candida TaxID=158441 RepID=UPI001604C5C7|nr:uncharacterized protein LOC118435055 [Folsomia candida]
MSKLNSITVHNFHPILPEVFASEAVEFDLKKFRRRNPPKIFKTNVLGIYKIFYNFLYYIYVVPCKVQYDSTEDSIQIHGSKYKKGVCIVLHIVHFIHSLPPIYGSINEITMHVGSDPSEFYRMLFIFASFIMIMTFSIACMTQFRLQRFLTHLYQFRQKETKSKHRLVAYSLIFVGFSIVAIYVVTLKIVKLDFRSLQQFVDSGIQDVARHFQLNTNQSNILEFMSNNNMTQISTQLDIEIVGKLVFIALHLLFATFNYILAVMLEVLVFLTCFAVCQLGYDFWDAVKSGSWSLQELMQCYEEMQSVMDELNATLGVQILSFLVAGIPYYGVNIVKMFDENWFQKLETIYFLLLYSSALLLAAEGHRKFQQFPEFIFHARKQFGANHEELSIFLTQMTTSQIGYKGFGFFTVRYGFLGNVLGLVLTHVIIMLQFKTTGKC